MIDYVFLLVFVCLPSALITGYIAHMNNRSLWRWMLFGLCVPFVAIFVTMVVTYLDQKRAAGNNPDSGSDQR
ncbi:hypothetical protein [Hymenobacter chitinivorans]|uniref:Uncharacterized protein n=1 Tax=Hymenobacter chitinivorans DSM 11115 TaxID=1121954 RepID=A0A2M9BT67_9BACT|nr:hypothetical protein [Hymenobacter chitinivorans]PJJ61150.1 hypothetical protein CLV45_2588 [Hymenobacter chitinivorans DSM 11115]